DGRMLNHQVQALARIGSIPDNISEAVDFGHALATNMLKHRLQCFKIAVNVADDRPLRHALCLAPVGSDFLRPRSHPPCAEQNGNYTRKRRSTLTPSLTVVTAT